MFYGILHRIISLFRQLPDTFALTTTTTVAKEKNNTLRLHCSYPYDFNDMLNEKPFDMVKIIDHSKLNELKNWLKNTAVKNLVMATPNQGNSKVQFDWIQKWEKHSLEVGKMSAASSKKSHSLSIQTRANTHYLRQHMKEARSPKSAFQVL